MTSPATGRLNGGPCRHGVAVTRNVGRPSACRSVWDQGVSPVPHAEPAGPGRRRDDSVDRREEAAAEVVEVVGVVVVGEQHGVDRAELAGPRAGPASLRDEVPHPKAYRRPGGSNVGSVRSRHPSSSISTVGPPMCVSRTGQRALRSAQART